MGRLRASLGDCLGVKLDKDLLRNRLITMGVNDRPTLEKLMSIMEDDQKHKRFIEAITVKDGRKL